MVCRHYISNRNWWLAIGVAATVVTLPIACAVGVTIGVNTYLDWYAHRAREFAKSGWQDRRFEGTTVADTSGFASWLRRRPHWTGVWVKDAVVSVADSADLVRASQLVAIRFTNCSFDDGALERLARHVSVRNLVINACGSDVVDLRAFAASRSLASLEITDCAITPAVARGIAEIRGLERLSLARCGLGEESISAIASLPALESLSLADIPLAARSLDDLANLPNLRFLDISGTNIGDEVIPTIERMPRLREIDVVDVRFPPSFTRDGLERLRHRCPHLIITHYRDFPFGMSMNCGGWGQGVAWADD